MRVSITSDMFNYSFRPSMARKLALFAENEFEYLHWCDDWNNDTLYTAEDMERYRGLVEDSGLKCLDVHGTATTSINIDGDDTAQRAYIRLLENRIKFCSILSGDSVVVHPPRYETPRLDERLKRSRRVLDAVRPLSEELGINVSVENCHRSDEKILEEYFCEFPPEFVGFCFDSGHANLNGNIDELTKFGDRLKVLHLHDNYGDRDEHQPPFNGNIDWGRVMEWIGGSGYGKPLNFEVTHYRELFKGSMVEFMELTVESIGKVLELYARADYLD